MRVLIQLYVLKFGLGFVNLISIYVNANQQSSYHQFFLLWIRRLNPVQGHQATQSTEIPS